MKQTARRNRGAEPVSSNISPCSHMVDPTTPFSFAVGTSPCDAELVQLRARVELELEALRAERQLENWKYKAEAADAELAQLHDRRAKLERDLVQAQTDQLWTEAEGPRTQIEALLTELTEVKFKVEEVEVVLVQAQ